MDDPVRLALQLSVLMMSSVFHECAHVWAAWKQGDPTGKSLGRLTLNPVPHIDLFWTILLPTFMALTGGMIFGGPKPAPFNPSYFKNPRLGTVWVALAGPASNLLLAAAALLLLWAGRLAAPGFLEADSFNAYVLLSFILLNVVLAVVNLIPIPPLDGSRVLQYMLGPKADALFLQLNYFSLIAIYLTFKYIAPSVIYPAMGVVVHFLGRLFDGDYLDALFRTYSNL